MTQITIIAPVLITYYTLPISEKQEILYWIGCLYSEENLYRVYVCFHAWIISSKNHKKREKRVYNKLSYIKTRLSAKLFILKMEFHSFFVEQILDKNRLSFIGYTLYYTILITYSYFFDPCLYWNNLAQNLENLGLLLEKLNAEKNYTLMTGQNFSDPTNASGSGSNPNNSGQGSGGDPNKGNNPNTGDLSETARGKRKRELDENDGESSYRNVRSSIQTSESLSSSSSIEK